MADLLPQISEMRRFYQERPTTQFDGDDVRLTTEMTRTEASKLVRLLIEVEAVVQWQPIATAPKTIEERLVAHFHQGSVRATWLKVAWWSDAGKYWKIDGGICLPTHWMPLSQSHEVA